MSDSQNMESASESSSETRKTLFGFDIVPKDELNENLKSIKEADSDFSVTKRLEVLGEKEIARLKEAIHESKGVVRVFIHPSHVDLKEGEKAEDFDLMKYPPYKMLRDMMIHEKAPPIILLEDERTMDNNRMALEVIGRIFEKFNKHIYIMPTLQKNGFLKLPNLVPPKKDQNGEFENMTDVVRYGRIGMNQFSHFLTCVGATKLLVGGSSLNVDDEGLNHCVGSFVEDFKHVNGAVAKENGTNEISIQISTATQPHGRDELRKAGYNELL
jgi:hypothetical protein